MQKMFCNELKYNKEIGRPCYNSVAIFHTLLENLLIYFKVFTLETKFLAHFLFTKIVHTVKIRGLNECKKRVLA
jgi:hypothetical protein